jgi:Methyladenine glycosylase
MPRCPWAAVEPNITYHDQEWGVPVHDDRKLFEFLILEGAQAGLSWTTILKKRQNYRKAFDGFRAEKIARYGKRDVQQRMPARRAEQRDWRTGRECYHVVFPNIVQHQQSPALGKPCLGGGNLLLGRLGLDAKPEFRRQLGRDLGDGTLAAKLKHHRVERSLRLPGKLERELDFPQPGSP